MADRKPIELAEGWSFMQVMLQSAFLNGVNLQHIEPCRLSLLQNGINKLIRLLEGEPEEQFNAEQYMNLYT